LLEAFVTCHAEHEGYQQQGERGRDVEQHPPDEPMARDRWMCLGLVHRSSKGQSSRRLTVNGRSALHLYEK
jgi:hypothetical protein